MSKLRLRIGLNRYNLIKVFCYKLEKCTGIKCVIEIAEDKTYILHTRTMTLKLPKRLMVRLNILYMEMINKNCASFYFEQERMRK